MITNNDINKYLRYAIYAGIFIIPFIPLYVAKSMFFPFITGKNFSFRIIVAIILALWAILAMRDKSARPTFSYLLYAVIALLVVDSLATIFSLYPYRSFWSNYERMDGYLNILHLSVYFWVLISVFKNKIQWFWLANVSLVVNAIVAYKSFSQLAGWSQIYQSADRLEAYFGNAAYLAVYVLFHIFLASYLLLFQWNKNKILSVWYSIMIVANTIILYYTATRGAILGLIAGFILTCLILSILGKGWTRKISGAILGIIILLMIGFVSVKNTDFVANSQVLSRFSNLSLTEGTSQSRLMIWQMSWQGFKERPILGWGPENYPMVFSKYYNPGMWGQEPWFDRSHNIFFDWLIRAGLLGLLAYLSIYIVLLYYLWLGSDWRQRIKKSEKLIGQSLLTGLITAYFFHNIFVFDNLVSYIMFFSLVAFVHYLAVEDEGVKTDKNNLIKKFDWKLLHDKTVISILSVVIVLVTGLAIYFVNIRPIQASVYLIKALSPNQAGPMANLAYHQKIFALRTFGSNEALEQLASQTLNLVSQSEASDELKQNFVQVTDNQIQQQLSRFDNDARSNLFFGSYLSMTGRLDEGLSLLQRAQAISPQKQQILFQLASTYLQKQDLTSAVETARLAYDLEPNYVEARKLYAIVLLLTDQNDLAQEILAPIKNSSSYYNDNRFLQIYEQTKNYSALQEWKKFQPEIIKQ